MERRVFIGSDFGKGLEMVGSRHDSLCPCRLVFIILCQLGV